MLLNKAYYLVKPIMPRRVSTALRRWRAKSRRATYADVWPIDEKAGATPPGWPGWPAGKRFGFVLTHDVEGTRGLSRVEQLMDLELKYGFHSSFNFVPENEYRVPPGLRQKLDEAGFEVGVHGLKHDGKLYASKTMFARKAARIRDYLRDWNAVGFRSPLMQHNLAWIHHLGLEYDASTFDTDPFEPEPDGVGTIFPFWVPSPDGTGYVELPYTLVQDFTLFVVLQEPSIEIWKKKLDWIVERGGMALLNTHPDYTCFEGSPRRDEFPASLYEEFLAYVKEKYAGQFWNALPRDVSRYYCSSLPPAARNTRRRICMVTHSSYENDNRVRRYAESLAKRGDQVDVIAIGGPNVPLGAEVISGVNAHRVQSRDPNERTKWVYVQRLLRFLLTSSIVLTRRHHRIRYDLIHVHNMPDFVVFSAWYPKWTGVKIILDIHDITPEFFANKFGSQSDGLYVRLLKGIEKKAAAFADHVIVSNHLWHSTLTKRSVQPDKCSVFLNYVDPAIFNRRARTRGDDGKFIILFPGSFQWHQGLDIAIEALAHVRQEVPNAELHLYGGGGGAGAEERLRELARRLGLETVVKFCGSLALEQIADVIANADLGVVPKRADSFGNEAYSTKIMEFMSQGVPVVVSRTRIDTYYFDDNVVRFFPSGDSRGMADAILNVITSRPLREALAAAGLEYAERNNWNQKRKNYLTLVDSLTTEPFALSNSAQTAKVRTTESS